MVDLMIAEDGKTYEREMTEEHIKRQGIRLRSPQTKVLKRIKKNL